MRWISRHPNRVFFESDAPPLLLNALRALNSMKDLAARALFQGDLEWRTGVCGDALLTVEALRGPPGYSRYCGSISPGGPMTDAQRMFGAVRHPAAQKRRFDRRSGVDFLQSAEEASGMSATRLPERFP